MRFAELGANVSLQENWPVSVPLVFALVVAFDHSCTTNKYSMAG